METSVNNLTNDGILSEVEINSIKAVDAIEQRGNAYEVRQRDYAYETARDLEAEAFCIEAQEQAYRSPSQNKLFKMRVQQINLIEIEVEAASIDEAETKAIKTLENDTELGELLRTDFGHRSLEEI